MSKDGLMARLRGHMDHHNKLVCLFVTPTYLLVILISLAPAMPEFIEVLLGPVWLYLVLPILFIGLVVIRSYKAGGFSKFELIMYGSLFLMLAIVSNGFIELQLDDVKLFCGSDPMRSSLLPCILSYSFVHNSADISSLGVAAFGAGLLVTGVAKESSKVERG